MATTSPFRRAFVIVVDSLGVGELPDAAAYGDQGSNTLGNIAAQVPLRIPNLQALGISRVISLAGLPPADAPLGAYGRMAEVSPGKDSVTGHWELMGLQLEEAFPTFPDGFPEGAMREYERRIGRRTLGNIVASGTQIIDDLGPEHMKTGCPIIYTSADSVFQIAAHEAIIPVPELYRICEIAYTQFVEGMGLGRVIARPFVGSPGSFRRTANRHDYAIPPYADTLLDRLAAAGIPVLSIGKIADLFAGRGIGAAVKSASDALGMDAFERAVADAPPGLVFGNLVDFDAMYGHRNDTAGYAANLERFDERLGRLLPMIRDDDLLILTADHGNDPTTPSTDHSREFVPVLAYGARVRAGVNLGERPTFADLGQTLAEVFGVGPLACGRSFLADITGAGS
ncbi:MAG: phosphopentomutase [Vicinamibacterales bacterium]|jgi:phosphopentomutase|nr:phosphopentomutase [Vicinamibacterales bacterium]